MSASIETLNFGISSDSLPNGLKLEITHKRDFDTNIEIAQPRAGSYNYCYLIYNFSDSQGNKMSARNYLDQPFEVSLSFVKPEFDMSNLHSTDSGVLLKSSYLTLCALGYSTIRDASRNLVLMSELNIDNSDVVNWTSEMDKLRKP